MSESLEAKIRTSPKRTEEKVRVLTAEEILYSDVEQTTGASKIPLQGFSIKGLLSFGEEANFEFGCLNILVGPNGSGKSNLIDCIRILRYSPFDIQETFEKSGFENWLYNDIDKKSGVATLQALLNLPDSSEKILHRLRLGNPLRSRAQLEETISRFNPDDESKDFYFTGSYRSEATLSVFTYSKRRRERKMEATEYDSFQSILSQIRDAGQYPEITQLANLYANFRIYSEWSFGRNSTLREAVPAGRSDTTLSELMDNLALALDALQSTSAHDKIRILLEELKESYRDFVTRTVFGRVGLEIIESPFEIPLPADRLSDGTLRFLALATILLQPTPPPLICLEEPELGMHPDMIRMVAGMIVDASTKTQIIVSTHSEHLLSALQYDFDALFAFDTGLTGSIVRRFDKNEYKDWQEEHNLGELWTSGELGGNRW